MDGQGCIEVIQGQVSVALGVSRHDANNAVQGSLWASGGCLCCCGGPCSGISPLGSLKPSDGHSIRAEGLVRWGGYFPDGQQ